ncbi:MAG TPA: hypothetical protein VHZ55_23960 [Bryobacteraceae bacterium]|nr:hypothetical protein [Bryobacteraceae bacterium]
MPFSRRDVLRFVPAVAVAGSLQQPDRHFSVSGRGYYSMDFDTNTGDPVTGTKRLVQESLKSLA